MTVKNLNGTADSKKCPSGSWLQHWKNYAKDNDPFCAEIICIKKATDGAHVQRQDGKDRRWYIIPLCHEHNTRFGDELEIMDFTELVLATDHENCKASKN
jgi:hypothetical protein